jgi:N-acetylmuramoyl-L-alanine amidase CwlD
MSRARAGLAAMVLCLAVGTAAAADTLVAAGKRIVSPVPLVFAAGEVYAPLLVALGPLRAGYVMGPEMITITTAGGRELSLSRTRPEASLDGEMHALPSVPQTRGDTILLPAKAVGELLGCAVRWSEESRTVYLAPAVTTFKAETTPECYRVTIGGEQPLSYITEKMEDPPRLVVDLQNVQLRTPLAPYRVEGSYLRGVRVAQHALFPDPKGDVVRLVVDLDEWQPYRVRLSEDRCRLRIELPLPGAELPSEAVPVVLTDFGFRRYSPKVALATLTASGKPAMKSGTTADPPGVWVEVENAENKVARDHLTATDRWVKGVALAPVPGRKGVQRLTLSLSEAVPSSVSCEGTQVRVLLGRCELSGVTIVVDAGHGGTDTGAIGRSGLMEKDVNLDIVERVGKLLEQAGAKVLYTRREDANVMPPNGNGNDPLREQLKTRCAVANDARADLFVSVHCNARGKNPLEVRGTETYYRKGDSVQFARVMQEEVVRVLGLTDGGAQYHPKSIIVLYQTDMPAVLVEVAYLSNPADEALLAESDFRQQAAQGIANGVRRYVQESSLLGSVLVRQEAPAGVSP